MLKLTWRNTIRHPLRAALTILGMAVAVLAFCLLRTVVAAWYAGVDASSPVRLVTRNSVSLMFPLPLAYLPKIQAVPDIVRVAHAYWFEGVYIDKRHFFPQFAASLPGYLDAYPEYHTARRPEAGPGPGPPGRRGRAQAGGPVRLAHRGCHRPQGHLFPRGIPPGATGHL